MKILQSSDWHLDAVTAGFSRFSDVARAVKYTVEEAKDLKVDFYLFSGDAHDPDGDTYLYTRFIMETAVELADSAIKSVWVPGNHDVQESGNGVTTLSPLRALHNSKAYSGKVFLLEEPTAIALAEDKALYALPFTSFDRNYDPAEAIRAMVRNTPASSVLVVSHLNIAGIEVGSETTDFPRGRDVFLPLEEIAKLREGRNVVAVSGHYHKRMSYEGIHVVGAVARLTFGEEEHSPSYQVITL